MTNTLSKYTVAVVDDDASMLRSTVRFLQAAGYTVLSFASAAEFLSRVGSANIDCAVVDVQMPRMNGFELSTELEKRGVSLPLFFMTAHDSPWTREQAADCGARGLLLKPFNPQRLLEGLTTILSPIPPNPIEAIGTLPPST